MFAGAPPHAFVQNRTIGDSGLSSVSELDAARLRTESVHEFVVNCIRNQNTIHRDAGVSHVGEGAARRGRGGLRYVGVAENYERAMAAEF